MPSGSEPLEDGLAIVFRKVHVENQQVDLRHFRVAVKAIDPSQRFFSVGEDVQDAVYIIGLERFAHQGHIGGIIFGYKNLERLRHVVLKPTILKSTLKGSPYA
jgi:hypothetical protein